MNVSAKNPGLSELGELCVATIRFLSIEGIQKASQTLMQETEKAL